MPVARKYILRETGEVIDLVSKVDTTLTLENIPADAKVVGELISDIHEKIDNIQIGTSEKEVINKPTHFDFPSIGSVDFIYKAYNEKKTYQWNAEKLKYEPLNEGGVLPEITIINGGNANGIND